MSTDKEFMQCAIKYANRAEQEGEVPVGAVLVHNGKKIAVGYNRVIGSNDPTAHAEIEVLRAAGSIFNNYRLNGSILYVTLEPCPMCAGAIVHSRVQKVVFGAFDERTGAAGSVFEILGSSKLNHRPSVYGGIEGETCGNLLRDFFEKRRMK